MKQDKETIKVIYRAYGNGDVVAIFPYVAAMNHPTAVACYEHDVKHSSMGEGYIFNLKPILRQHYDAKNSLHRELESLGYRLQEVKRFDRLKAWDARKAQIEGAR